MPMRGLTKSELQDEKHEKLNFDSENKEKVDSLSSFKEVLVARRREYKDKAFSSMSRKQILFWMNSLDLSFEELEKTAKSEKYD